MPPQPNPKWSTAVEVGGAAMPIEPTLQLLGGRVTAADNAANQSTDVTIQDQVQEIVAAGAITIKEGTVLIGGASATAATLPAPTPGGPGVGDDGRSLKIQAITAHAHTVTTPADKINGADDTVTYAAVGDFVILTAYNGIWYAVLGGPTPASLSEV